LYARKKEFKILEKVFQGNFDEQDHVKKSLEERLSTEVGKKRKSVMAQEILNQNYSASLILGGSTI
jgi:hypothetical protein